MDNMNNEDTSKILGTESVGKLLFKFSIPAIIGMLVNALYGIVDGIFIGQYVGSLGLAGVSVANPIMVVSLAFTMLISIGATSLISIRLGEGNKEDAEVILGNATTLLFIVPVILFVFIQIFLDDILRIFGASANVLPYARTYMSVVSYGFLFQSVGFGMTNFIRSEGNPKIAMLTMSAGAAVNIVLDAVFIIKLNMGIRGGALATVIAELVPAIWVLGYFLSDKSLLKIKKQNLKLRFDKVKNIIALGLAQFSIQIASSLVAVVANNTLLKYGGDFGISAFRIINNIAMIFFMPIFGINQGMQPIIGYNYGAQKFDRVKETLYLAIGAATGLAVLGFIVTRTFPHQLAMLFNKDDKALIDMTANGMKLFFTALPIIGFQIVASNYFQAIGKPRQSIVLGLLRQVIILIPAIIILPRFFGLNGIWLASPASDVISSLLTSFFIFTNIKELNRGIEVQHKL